MSESEGEALLRLGCTIIAGRGAPWATNIFPLGARISSCIFLSLKIVTEGQYIWIRKGKENQIIIRKSVTSLLKSYLFLFEWRLKKRVCVLKQVHEEYYWKIETWEQYIQTKQEMWCFREKVLIYSIVHLRCHIWGFLGPRNERASCELFPKIKRWYNLWWVTKSQSV